MLDDGPLPSVRTKFLSLGRWRALCSEVTNPPYKLPAIQHAVFKQGLQYLSAEGSVEERNSNRENARDTAWAMLAFFFFFFLRSVPPMQTCKGFLLQAEEIPWVVHSLQPSVKNGARLLSRS